MRFRERHNIMYKDIDEDLLGMVGSQDRLGYKH